MGVCVYVCVPDIYQNTNKKRKKTKKKSRHKVPNLRTKCLLCFFCRRTRDRQRSLSWSDTKELMGRKIHPWVLTQYKKKRRKWAEETAIVPPLTFLSNYAKVKAQVTRKIIWWSSICPVLCTSKRLLFSPHSDLTVSHLLSKPIKWPD